MKAFVRDQYGGPEVLRLEEVALPTPQEGQLLIKVMANSANPADWHILRGEPFFARFTFGLFKPKGRIIGSDFAGIVHQVGKNVTRFKVGDRVFGESLTGGVFAEYAAVSENHCAHIPEHIGFSTMACLPIAGLTALQALLTHGKIKKGETVLINGSSGGVGHFAVQIAKAYGAEVTAVCSGKNVSFVESLGADRVLAYDQEDIHRHTSVYDLVVDTHGNLHFEDYKRMGRRGVMTGFTTMGHMISVLLKKSLSNFPLVQFTAQAKQEDLVLLAKLLKDSTIRIHIDTIFSYEQIPEAIRYIEAMRTRGKVAMVWHEDEEE